MEIQFWGAAQHVTGSKHLLTTPKGTKILLDCGMFQGRIPDRENLNRHFGFAPHDLDYVILSHAHIDHSGLLPRLVREGFKGIIFATPATIDLCELMLLDSAHIQADDLKFLNQRRHKKSLSPFEPLYDIEDVERALDLMTPVEYDEALHIDKEVTLTYTDAGHLIGSACVHLDIKTPEKKIHLTFTGDIGRKDDPILRNPERFRQCDVLICESTYGDRLHPQLEDSNERLYQLVKEICVEKKGKLIIPAFSVDRTQEIVYSLEKMSNTGRLPDIKIYVDSPLSVKATDVIRRHEECFNDEFVEYMHKDPKPFEFKNLHYITQVEDSKRLNSSKEPCIIISASGMAEAGRIKHHIANNLDNPNNCILLVGYCTPESLGGRLKAGNKAVRIFGEEHIVKAQVHSMESYSSHADYDEIFAFLNNSQDKQKIRQIFLVHGEPEVQTVFKQKFIEHGYTGNIHIPVIGETFEI
jgi:metallo-beta-lactamase family protein